MHAENTNVVHFTPKPSDGAPRAGLRASLAKHMETSLQALFDHLDDSLFERADLAENNLDADLYFDAMRTARLGREAVQEDFVNRCQRQLDQFWRQSPNRAEVPSSLDTPLSLVDKSDTEEQLAVTNLISKARHLYHEPLYALDQRLALSTGREPLEGEENPLSPDVFGHAFRDSLPSLDIPLKVRLVIYKLFDRHVIGQLGPLYEELNQLLVQAGFLPEMRYNPVLPETTSRHPLPATELSQETPASSTDASLFSELRGLLGAARGQSVTPGMPVLAQPALLESLSQLQTTQLMALPEEGMKQWLRVQMAANDKDKPARFGEDDEDTIDVVEMLFEFILDDRNVPEALRALIARLQIPVLKAAIMDKQFFSDPRYPARHLLNELAHAALGWNEAEGRGPGSLFERFESVVDRVVSEYRDDASVFAEVLESFLAREQQEEQGRGCIEQRTAQMAEGQERLKLAQNRVAHEVGQRTCGQVLPPLVSSFLEEAWSPLLVLIQLRDGPSGDSWSEAISTLEKLIWSVQPKADREQRQRLVREMPGLLKALRDGIQRVSFAPYATARFFKELQALHLERIKDHTNPTAIPKPPARRETPPQGSPGTQEIVLETQGAEPPAEPDRFDRIVERLEPGDWLEFDAGEDPAQRARIAWRSPRTGHTLFVNHRGLKVCEHDPVGLAQTLRDEKAVVLEKLPMLERAFEAVNRRLRQAMGTPPTLATENREAAPELSS